jgi:hypothetical protein
MTKGDETTYLHFSISRRRFHLFYKIRRLFLGNLVLDWLWQLATDGENLQSTGGQKNVWYMIFSFARIWLLDNAASSAPHEKIVFQFSNSAHGQAFPDSVAITSGRPPGVGKGNAPNHRQRQSEASRPVRRKLVVDALCCPSELGSRKATK